MPWYDVYDNVEVQLLTRRQAAAVTGIVTVVLAVSAACLSLGLAGVLSLPLAVFVALLVGSAFIWWFVRRIRRLRRIVWCVKISREEVVGYDYGRRKRALEWSKVERVEVDDGSLTIVGPQPVSLEITHLFADFHCVSHRIVHFADRHAIPIFVHGKPWQQIDVYAVYPFLSRDESSPTRGSAAV